MYVCMYVCIYLTRKIEEEEKKLSGTYFNTIQTTTVTSYEWMEVVEKNMSAHYLFYLLKMYTNESIENLAFHALESSHYFILIH